MGPTVAGEHAPRSAAAETRGDLWCGPEGGSVLVNARGTPAESVRSVGLACGGLYMPPGTIRKSPHFILLVRLASFRPSLKIPFQTVL